MVELAIEHLAGKAAIEVVNERALDTQRAREGARGRDVMCPTHRRSGT